MTIYIGKKYNSYDVVTNHPHPVQSGELYCKRGLYCRHSRLNRSARSELHRAKAREARPTYGGKNLSG
jgi:hypothetical protein